jgi:hypothetical protein
MIIRSLGSARSKKTFKENFPIGFLPMAPSRNYLLLAKEERKAWVRRDLVV